MRFVLVAAATILLVQQAEGSPLKEPAAAVHAKAQAAAPTLWTLKKRPLSVEMTTASPGGTKLILSCSRTSTGMIIKQLFLADVEAAWRPAGSRLGLNVDGKAIPVVADGVDNGLALGDTTTDNMTAITDKTFRAILGGTQIVVSSPERAKRTSLAFRTAGGQSLAAPFAAACRAVKL